MMIPPIPKRTQFIIFGAIVVLIAMAPSLYFYQKYQKAQLQITNPTAVAQQDAQVTIAAVAKLIILPTGETPTVAVVQDITKLRDQTFFAHAKNGDKVLIYTIAKKAILYRPSINKIIDVAPVNLGSSSGATPTPSAAPQTYSLILRNGTAIVGLAKTYGVKVTSKVTNVTIRDYQDAANKSYQKTIVVDVKGDKGDAVSQIATTLGISTGPMPAGEASASADFLIIVGADQK